MSTPPLPLRFSISRQQALNAAVRRVSFLSCDRLSVGPPRVCWSSTHPFAPPPPSAPNPTPFGPARHARTPSSRSAVPQVVSSRGGCRRGRPGGGCGCPARGGLQDRSTRALPHPRHQLRALQASFVCVALRSGCRACKPTTIMRAYGRSRRDRAVLRVLSLPTATQFVCWRVPRFASL